MIRGAINLLTRLLPPIIESDYVISYSFFWSKPKLHGKILCTVINKLLFKEGFAIGSNLEGNVSDSIEYPVWHSGLIYKKAIHDNEAQYYQNRLAIIKLALISFSSILYLSSENTENFMDTILWLFCSQWNLKVKEIVYSLLNFTLCYSLDLIVNILIILGYTVDK